MDELWPNRTVDIAIADRIAAERRDAPPTRPWTVMMMIASLDGAAELDGLSGGLGAPADKQQFSAVREVADVVVAGASTVRAEDYRPPPMSDAQRQRRLARGQRATPRLAIVSGSLALDPHARAFGDADNQPMIYTSAEAAGRDTDLHALADVIGLDPLVTPVALGRDLRDRGVDVAVLEGGPSLNAQFLAADVVDELVLTLAPLVVGGDARRIVNGPIGGEPRGFELDRAMVGDGLLLMRYLRAR